MSLPAPWDFYFRAFRSPGSPRAPAGYHYEVESGAGAPALGSGGTTPFVGGTQSPRRESRHFRSGPQSGSHGHVSRPLLIKPDVRISRIRLSDEIMYSPTEGHVSSTQGG